MDISSIKRLVSDSYNLYEFPFTKVFSNSALPTTNEFCFSFNDNESEDFYIKIGFLMHKLECLAVDEHIFHSFSWHSDKKIPNISELFKLSKMNVAKNSFGNLVFVERTPLQVFESVVPCEILAYKRFSYKSMGEIVTLTKEYSNATV